VTTSGPLGFGLGFGGGGGGGVFGVGFAGVAFPCFGVVAEGAGGGGSSGSGVVGAAAGGPSAGFHASVVWHFSHVVPNVACSAHGTLAASARWQSTHALPVPRNTGGRAGSGL
jgi:hypothetical protein